MTEPFDTHHAAATAAIKTAGHYHAATVYLTRALDAAQRGEDAASILDAMPESIAAPHDVQQAATIIRAMHG